MSDPLLPSGEPTAAAPAASTIDSDPVSAPPVLAAAVPKPDAESNAEPGAGESGTEAEVTSAGDDTPGHSEAPGNIDDGAMHDAAAEPLTAADADADAATETTEAQATDTAAAATAAPVADRPAVPELSPAACAARLAELFPALFKGQPKPLKLRIQADIQQRVPGVFTKKSLSAFLHRYTTTTGYLIALTQTGQRFDLDGAPAGALDEVHVAAAANELARRRSMHEARRAAEQAAHRAAEAETRQARAAEDDARRDRAMLLRAFETSTLTRANFCALKRIAEPELDTLLATARQEAAQRAQEGWGDPRQDRSGPGPNERGNERWNDRRNDRPLDGPRSRPHDPRQAHPQNRRPEGRSELRADGRPQGPQDGRGPGGRPPGHGPRPEDRGPRRPAGPPKEPR